MRWANYLLPLPSSVRKSFLLVVRRVPLSLAMVVGIFATAALTNTLAHPISGAVLDRWGFGLEQLRDGRAYQLFFAPFQVYRPYMAISISVAVLFFVGICEYRLGTWRAMGAFWVGHIVGAMGSVVVLALLGHAGSIWAMNAALTTDVGASSGAFAAAGAVLLFFGSRVRRFSFAALSVYLVLALVLEQRNWDVAHILGLAAGIGVGRYYLWRLGRSWPALLPRWQLERRQRPALVAWALRVTGMINILAAFLLPQHAGFARLEAWMPVGGPHWPRHLLLVTGLLLLVLAPGLARRQWTAWWGALFALALSVFMHLQVGIAGVEAAIAGTFMVVLIVWRREFRAPPHTPSLRSGLRLLVLIAVTIPLYGLVGFFILRSRFDPPVTLTGAFGETLSRVFFLSTPSSIAEGRPAQWFLDSIPLFAWIVVVYAVARVVRSSVAPGPSPTELDVARQLLKTHGNTGTSYMTLWKGNALFFTPGQRSYVAYRVNSGVAVALGNPIGAPDAIAETIVSFTKNADDHGWIPVFHAATQALLGSYKDAGYDALQIGEEAIISLPPLEFRGREWQDVRTSINRAGRADLTFRMFEGGTIPAQIRKQLFEISDEWNARHELPPMGFTLGTTEDVDDPNINVGVAFDASMRVHGYVDWLPVYGRRGWVIDLMRRRDDAMRGVMDFLIAMSFMAFKQRGYETASLGTAPLADANRGEATSLLQWLLAKVYEKSQTYYDFRSLFQYKEKFQPKWESIYLVHRGLDTLPAAAAGLFRAYLPDLRVAQATKLIGESAGRWLFPHDDATG